MSKIKNAFRLLVDAKFRFSYLSSKGFYKGITDEKFLKKLYRNSTGKELDLESPKGFNEKIQWLKLYDRRPVYTIMADKCDAKDYVSTVIGDGHVIPTLGVWDNFDEIDFDSLPDQFVLKCTHNSGGLVICKDKTSLNFAVAKKRIERSLRKNYYWSSREWSYKDIKPRIIAEQYMEDQNEAEGLTDYKFFCFNGEPKFLYVSQGLQDHATASISFLTPDWKFAPYERSDYKPLAELPRKPECLDQMLDISRKLSREIPFVRVDLYEINGKIYFSELTFYPCAGLMPFKDPAHDLEIGQMLELPNKGK